MVKRFCTFVFLALFCLSGLKAQKLNIIFVHSNNSKFADGVAKLKAFIEAKTNFEVTTMVAQPGAYIEIIEALGSGKADVAFINTFGYLLAHDLYGSKAVLQVLRGNNNTAYQGQIVTHKDSKIKDLQDLKGKKFAFMNQYSSTGFILPDAMLKAEKIKTFNSHYSSWQELLEAVYQRQVDAGATYYLPKDSNGKIQDARKLLLKKYPKIEEELLVIGKTPKLLNEPIVVRHDLPVKTTEALTAALLSYAADEVNLPSLDALYNISGFRKIKDEDYNSTRSFIVSSGRQVADVVPGAAGLLVKEYKRKNTANVTTPVSETTATQSELHLAAKKANISKLRELLGKENINRKDSSGNTALHVAAATRFWGPDYWLPYRTVKFLLEKGASVDIRNNQGKTALDLAKLSGNTEMVALLKKHGAK